MGNIDLCLGAFGNGLRNVQMIRHPVSLIDSWLRRDWGNRYGADPLAFAMCIRHQDQDLPFYAVGWEDVYLTASPLGRVIRMIEGVWDRNLHAYQSANEAQQRQGFFIPFEDFVQKPFAHLEPLAEFIGSAITKQTQGAVKRENCPRSLPGDIAQKAQLFEKQMSPEESVIMHRLIEEYEILARECSR